ncbi:MAG: hypothetical protein HOP33_14980 [Verrucomicrobia bacterium]|nr:hypothetical protein [Verrucomicrobiota bacterium]
MNGNSGELSLSAVRAKRASVTSRPAHEQSSLPPLEYDFTSSADSSAQSRSASPNPGRAPRFDPWRMAAALKAHSQFIWSVAGATAVLAAIVVFLISDYRVRMTLIAREAGASLSSAAETEAYRPHPFNAQTLVNLMSSTELLRRVASKSSESEDSLRGRVSVELVPNTDIVGLKVSGKSKKPLVALANLFGDEAVALGRELQSSESAQMEKFCREKLVALDQQLAQANGELIRFQNAANLADPEAERQGYVKQLTDMLARSDNAHIEAELLDLQVNALQTELLQRNPVSEKLEGARNKLTDLTGRYTEIHPTVQSQRKLITELEKQVVSAGETALSSAKYSDNPQVASLYVRYMDLQTRKMTVQREMTELAKLKESLQKKVTGLSENGLRYANLKAQVDGLQKSRALLANRQREAQLYQEHAQGYYRVFAPAKLQDVDSATRWFNAFLGALAGILLGLGGAALVVVGQEVTGGKLKTAADVKRVTGLPVLAALGDLEKMSPEEKDAWAFRTWTAISGQLNPSPNHGLVCGFISAGASEGRSTWIRLLADAAKKRGLQVMTIAAGTTATATTTDPAGNTAGTDTATTASSKPESFSDIPLPLAARDSQHSEISLPGAVWNLARRKEWQNTLAHLRQMDNLVVLIELPPASLPESVLMAESLPQVIWLADSGKSSARETRQQLETLRHGRCRLAGAVLNHEPKPMFEL